jgi:hypothetical protein
MAFDRLSRDEYRRFRADQRAFNHLRTLRKGVGLQRVLLRT